jgi:integrase
VVDTWRDAHDVSTGTWTKCAHELITGIITIDAQTGALHEVHGHLELGPPKTAASVRTMHPPPFLITLLAAHYDRHPHEHVFTGPTNALLRRGNFRRRIWCPALVRAGLLGEITPIEGRGLRARWTTEDGVDREEGFRALPAAVTRVAVHAAGGLHFHDLRHTHKTWLIEDDVPEVAQCKRMGHELGGVRGIYSHVTQPMIDALPAGLQARWERSIVTSTDLDVLTTYGVREAL